MKKIWCFKANESIGAASGIIIRGILGILMGSTNSSDTRERIPLGHGDAFAFPCFRTSLVVEDDIVEAFRSTKCNSYSPSIGVLPARRHHLNVDTCCQMCGESDEDINHTFFLCPWAARLWFAAEFNFRVDDEEIKKRGWLDWIFNLVEHADSFLTTTKIACILYYWWNCRNSYCLEGKKIDVLGCIIAANSLWLRWWSTKNPTTEESTLDTNSNNEVLDHTWIEPPPGYIKINYDASFLVSSKTGKAAAVDRDSNGDILGVASKKIRVPNAEMAEFVAAELAVLLAIRIQEPDCIFEGVCGNVCMVLAKKTKANWECSALAKNIVRLSSLLRTSTFIFFNRQGNGYAHDLAKQHLSSDNWNVTYYVGSEVLRFIT